MAPWEEYQAAAAAGSTSTATLKPWEEYAAAETDTLPEVAATQSESGNGFLAKVNAALRKPSPEILRNPEAAVRELVTGMIPHDIPSYLESIYPPAAAARAGANVAQGDFSGIPFVGRVPEIMEAEETPAGSKERYLAAMKTLMDVGMLAGAGERAPIPLRPEPLVPEPPPTQSMGPGTIAGDVSRALERQSAAVEPTLADQITQQEPLAPVTPETLADKVTDAQARRLEWEQKVEADRKQQNVNTMAERLYNDALKEAKGPGPRDLAAESLLSQRKRAAQIVTGDRDVLAAFDRAHQMATERAETRHGRLLSKDRPTRYVDYTGAQPEFAPEFTPGAVEAIAPEAAAVSGEAPVSPVTAPTKTAPVEPGTEPVINAPSTLPKKHIDDLIPFNIQGNKTSLLAKHIGGLVEKVAGISRRTIDAFAGSGTYTHFIRRLGFGKEGDILNEFDPLRAITHKQIRDNPAAVGAAVDRFREELDGMLDVKSGDPWSLRADSARKMVSAYFRNKFPEFFEPGQDLVDLAIKKKPVEMVDSPELAGLYTLAQNQAFNFLPIQAELSPKQYPGTLKQPGFSVIENGKGTVIKGYKSKTRNATAIINAAGERFKRLDVRRGDGWKLIREEAKEGDFVPVDTSYLDKGPGEKTANYNAATREDANPSTFLRKVSENLLPAWEKGARLLITNNYDPIVAGQLRKLGFEVTTAERSRSISGTASKELVATNFDHETGAVYPRGVAVLRFAAEEANRPVGGGGGGPVSAGGTGELAPGPQGQNAAVPGRSATIADRNRQILARRQGILDRKAELTARAANGEQGLEPQLAAVQADLLDPSNPVVHAPPPQAPVVEPLAPVTQPVPPEGPVQAPGGGSIASEAPGGVPVAEDANAQLNRILGTQGKITEAELPSTPEPYTQEAAAQRAAAEAAQPPVQTEVPGTVGISEARTKAELGPGSVVPGAGAEMGSGLVYGREYVNKGGDPRLPIRRANTSGMVGKNDVGIVHAELDRLRVERNKAAAALEANPVDPVLQQNFSAADDAQRAWRRELQPVLTKASDALREAHAASMPDADVGTYQGLADLMDEHFKGERTLSPEERTALAKAAKGVKESRDIANGEMGKVEAALEKQVRARGKKTLSPEELEASIKNRLETEFVDCALGA